MTKSKWSAREMLLAITIANHNNWNDIYNCLRNKEYDCLEDEFIQDAVESYDGTYITILDDDYPEILKQSYKPPFILFMERAPW